MMLVIEAYNEASHQSTITHHHRDAVNPANAGQKQTIHNSSDDRVDGHLSSISPSNNTCYPNPSASYIDLTQQGLMTCSQSCNEWCWATIITETVTFVQHQDNHHNCGQDECNLVSDLFDLNHGSGTIQCCSIGCSSGCNIIPQPSQIISIINSLQVYAVLTTTTSSPLSSKDLQLELSQLRPLILGYSSLSGGHIVIMVGFNITDGMFYLHDPWTDQSYQATYDQLQIYNEYNWTITISQITADNSCIGNNTNNNQIPRVSDNSISDGAVVGIIIACVSGIFCLMWLCTPKIGDFPGLRRVIGHYYIGNECDDQPPSLVDKLVVGQ